MIRIAITAAFEAIAATLPLGSMGYEAEPNAKGERLIWLEEAVESTSRLVEIEARGAELSQRSANLVTPARRGHLLTYGTPLVQRGARRAAAAPPDGARRQRRSPMEETMISEYARQLMEAHGEGAIAEAAQRAVACEERKDKEGAEGHRRGHVEAALKAMRGPSAS